MNTAQQLARIAREISKVDSLYSDACLGDDSTDYALADIYCSTLHRLGELAERLKIQQRQENLAVDGQPADSRWNVAV